jgi:hypothetical protein
MKEYLLLYIITFMNKHIILKYIEIIIFGKKTRHLFFFILGTLNTNREIFMQMQTVQTITK